MRMMAVMKPLARKSLKRCFSVMTIVRASPILPAPWDAIGQLETASGNLCTATLITPQLALTAGHCLLTPPDGKPDKAVALRFVSQKGMWRYEIHGIEGRLMLPSANV